MTSGVYLVLLSLLAAAASGVLVWALWRWRRTPDERERQRRLRLQVLGRMHDGVLTDAQGDMLYYTYSVHGVDYHAAQEISALRALVPRDAALIIGPVTLKYLPRNPANSILVSEQWSGLRIRRPAAEPANHSEERINNNEADG